MDGAIRPADKDDPCLHFVPMLLAPMQVPWMPLGGLTKDCLQDGGNAIALWSLKMPFMRISTCPSGSRRVSWVDFQFVDAG